MNRVLLNWSFGVVFATVIAGRLSVANAEELNYRLVVDDQLTSVSTSHVEGLGRCVALSDFASVLGAEVLTSATASDLTTDSVGLRLDGREWRVRLGEGLTVEREGRVFVPAGFLCLQLGLRPETDERYGLLRARTSPDHPSFDEFVKQNKGLLEAERLRRIILKKGIHAGVLAIDGRVYDNLFTLVVDNRVFVPVREVVDILGGRVEQTASLADPSQAALRIDGDAGSIVLEEARDLSCRGFKLAVAYPGLSHRDKVYVAADLVAEVLQAQVERYEELSATRFLRKTTASAAAPLSSGPEIDRALAAARRQESKFFKTAYLTFDDGPSRRVTPEVLDALKRHRVKATFFILGMEAKARPALLQRIADEGHVIGNHTYSHKVSNLYRGVEGFMNEIARTDDLFQEILGNRSKMARAAYGTAGNFTSKYYERMHEKDFKIYGWNIDSGDSRSLAVKADEIIENVRKGVAGLSEVVILFHDAATKMETAKALPKIIEMLQEMDFEIEPLRYDTPIRTKGIVK